MSEVKQNLATVTVVNGVLVDVSTKMVVGVPIQAWQRCLADSNVIEGVLTDLDLLLNLVDQESAGMVPSHIVEQLISNIRYKLSNTQVMRGPFK